MRMNMEELADILEIVEQGALIELNDLRVFPT